MAEVYNEQMPKILNFRVIIEQDENGVFVASVPAIPGCHTQGDTYEEALKNVGEAIKVCLDEAGENAKYHSQISWPTEGGESRFLGVVEVPVRMPASA